MHKWRFFTALTGFLFSVFFSFAQNEGLVLNAHSMVYHETEQVTYIFGGATEAEVTNDLRIFDGSSIKPIAHDYKPGPRTFASIVYQQADSSILLFGGSAVLFGDGPDGTDLKNDTWLYKSGQWKQLDPLQKPKPRAHAAIGYDEARKRVVLFGGFEIVNGKYLPLGDTWEFYDDNWHLVSQGGPSPRMGSAMAFSAEQRKIVLFGGNDGNRLYGEGTGETWTWDGKSWFKLKMDQPPNLFDSNMVFLPKTSHLLRYGGWTGKSRTDETWILAEGMWQKLELATRPPARNHGQMIFDKANGRVVLFGGHNGAGVYGDLWVFTNNRWQQLINTPTRKRISNKH